MVAVVKVKKSVFNLPTLRGMAYAHDQRQEVKECIATWLLSVRHNYVMLMLQ